MREFKYMGELPLPKWYDKRTSMIFSYNGTLIIVDPERAPHTFNLKDMCWEPIEFPEDYKDTLPIIYPPS